MTRQRRDEIQNIRLGAIYRLAAARRLERAVIELLLVQRAWFSAMDAHVLVGHWLTTQPFRAA